MSHAWYLAVYLDPCPLVSSRKPPAALRWSLQLSAQSRPGAACAVTLVRLVGHPGPLNGNGPEPRLRLGVYRLHGLHLPGNMPGPVHILPIRRFPPRIPQPWGSETVSSTRSSASCPAPQIPHTVHFPSLAPPGPAVSLHLNHKQLRKRLLELGECTSASSKPISGPLVEKSGRMWGLLLCRGAERRAQGVCQYLSARRSHTTALRTLCSLFVVLETILDHYPASQGRFRFCLLFLVFVPVRSLPLTGVIALGTQAGLPIHLDGVLPFRHVLSQHVLTERLSCVWGWSRGKLH